jgi:hypothetical protein
VSLGGRHNVSNSFMEGSSANRQFVVDPPLHLQLSQTRRAKTIGRRYRRYFGINRRNSWPWTVHFGIQLPCKLGRSSDSDRSPPGRSRQSTH